MNPRAAASLRRVALGQGPVARLLPQKTKHRPGLSTGAVFFKRQLTALRQRCTETLGRIAEGAGAFEGTYRQHAEPIVLRRFEATGLVAGGRRLVQQRPLRFHIGVRAVHVHFIEVPLGARVFPECRAVASTSGGLRFPVDGGSAWNVRAPCVN